MAIEFSGRRYWTSAALGKSGATATSATRVEIAGQAGRGGGPPVAGGTAWHEDRGVGVVKGGGSGTQTTGGIT